MPDLLHDGLEDDDVVEAVDGLLEDVDLVEDDVGVEDEVVGRGHEGRARRGARPTGQARRARRGERGSGGGGVILGVVPVAVCVEESLVKFSGFD